MTGWAATADYFGAPPEVVDNLMQAQTGIAMGLFGGRRITLEPVDMFPRNSVWAEGARTTTFRPPTVEDRTATSAYGSQDLTYGRTTVRDATGNPVSGPAEPAGRSIYNDTPSLATQTLPSANGRSTPAIEPPTATGRPTDPDFVGPRRPGDGTPPEPATMDPRPRAPGDAGYNPDWSTYQLPNGRWNYPPNGGFDGPKVPSDLAPGTTVDRIGAETGSYFAPQGTPYGQRSLPPSSVSEPYYAYEVVRNVPVYEGTAAPAFDQAGGGRQFEVNWTAIADANALPRDFYRSYPGGGISWLVDNGYLNRLTPGGTPR
jgi:Tuberculosis necrotizing toxin